MAKESLIKQKGRVKARLTSFGNFLTSLEDNPKKQAELPSRIEKTEGFWTEFGLIQDKIEEIDDSDEQLQQRDLFEDSFHQLISKARQLTAREHVSQFQNLNNTPQPGVTPPIVLNERVVNKPLVKLPSIDSPKFDGNYERWIPFRDLFDSLIASNITLSPVQKLHYLRVSLTGEAAKVINSIELTNDNYEVAWQLLKQRYENKKLIVQYLIQALFDLPSINREFYSDLRLLADNISQHVQALMKLDQPVMEWATLIIHVIMP
ncbi:uncharacterized protein LOC105194393 [Solenopsis invicta]|uniref:uncharacterized protein LOC105194393 n=1 Tax=Solenopsis invicta TaxID=13686 RepID=UPI00193E204E|nr:uncharacterized protein LOC105194393 [Solenopsis invicta]